jgi:hypothetical protein
VHLVECDQFQAHDISKEFDLVLHIPSRERKVMNACRPSHVDSSGIFSRQNAWTTFEMISVSNSIS